VGTITPSVPLGEASPLESVVQTPSSAPAEIDSHFFRQQYLFAFATQAEIRQYLRTQTAREELTRLQQIVSSWNGIQAKVADIMRSEAGFADGIRVTDIPDEHRQKLDFFASDPSFRSTFSSHRVTFGLVEIDRLIAPQRTVNLDYVDRLVQRFPSDPDLKQLLEICVSPKREMEPIQHLEIGPNTHVFSSPNSDIRFLGAFVKELNAEDVEHAVHGGLPCAAIIAFVGYGGAPINVFQWNGRVVLNNGFHRVYALRSMGVTQIPVVIQHANNPQLEFPAQVAGLPREYLLGAPRPVTMKDFFEPGFAITLKVRDRRRAVTFAIAPHQHDVPV
jgi:hypothetical protein